MKAGLVRILVAAALLLGSSAHAADTGIAAMLAEADRVRTSDPQRYATLLETLDRVQDRATATQRRHLRVLQNHRRAMLGQAEAAIGDLSVLIDQAPEPEVKYRAALLVANIHAINRDYVPGLRLLQRAGELQAQVGDPVVRRLSDVVAGTLYNEFGHHDRALEHAQRLVADRPDPRNLCFARQIRAHALHALGRPLDDQRDLLDAASDCAALNEQIAVAAIRSTLAEHWAARGKTGQAIALLEATLPDAEKTRYPRLVAELRSQLARYSLDRGDAMAAQAHAAVVATMPGADVRSRAYAVAQQVLYQVALDRQDLGTALRHFRLYAAADKARLDDIKAREYAYQLVQHETAKKTQSIALLSHQNDVLRLQREIAERKAWNFRLAIALLVVVAASAAYWGWRARRMHKNLRQLANTDGLTGLANRRHFRARTEAALKTCAQRGRPLSVVLFDLDHFKQINDQCGHSSGDWVLQEVARVGRRHCREGDLYGRIGGEEFAMALIDCDIDMALRIADECRRSIEVIDASVGTGCALPVAASVGVVSSSISGYDYETLVAHADAAMYRSKVAGRNRTSLYQPPPVPAASQPLALDARTALRGY